MFRLSYFFSNKKELDAYSAKMSESLEKKIHTETDEILRLRTMEKLKPLEVEPDWALLLKNGSAPKMIYVNGVATTFTRPLTPEEEANVGN